MEEASVGRVRGGCDDRRDETDGVCTSDRASGDIGCSSEGEAAAFRVSGVDEEGVLLGSGGALAVRSGSAAGDVGVGESRPAAALTVACEHQYRTTFVYLYI